MTPDQIAKWNAELRHASPLEIVRWAIAQADGRAIVSTNFRPYEAVILHLAVQVQPDIPVLWVDHGYNRPATYKHAEELRKLLNLKTFGLSPANDRRAPRRDPWPDSDDRGRGRPQGIQRGDETGTVPARHEGTRASESGSPRCARCRIRIAPDSTSFRTTRISARSRSARCSTGATPTWKPIWNKHNLPERMGLFRSRQGRRETRVRPARRVGRKGRAAVESVCRCQ